MLTRTWKAAARAARAHPAATVLCTLTLLLYLPGIWWGVPFAVAPDRVQAWGSDELAPLGPVAELHSVFLARAPRTFNPQYPLLQYLVQAVFVAPYLGWLFVTGRLSGPYTDYPFGLVDPATALMVFTLLARVP
ncbi:MAG: hypothetical protein OEW06_14835, partial [Gemmatimonadota bacterium]|nr:hypothetical protein [Gemmatimonadota bacterium]